MTQVKYNLKLKHDNTWHMDRLHFHEDAELLLSMSEGGNFFIENRLHPLRYGTLLLIGEGTLHKSFASESYRRYVLHIPLSVLAELSTQRTDFAERMRSGAHCIQLRQDQTSELIAMLTQLEQPFDDSFGGDVRRTVLLLEVLLKVCALYDTGDTASARPVKDDFAQVSPIIEYIRQNLSQQLSLEKIAAQFFISKYYLCHIFKAATGFGVAEYIIKNRILKARGLLRGGMRVQEAGEAVGFQSNAHFIRTFGALTGTSPKKYAKEYLVGDKSQVND